MSALATPEDLQAHWTDAGDVRVEIQQASLEYASALLRDEVSDIDGRVTDGTLDAVIVRGVVCEMVRRHLSDPVRSEQMEDTTFTYDTKWLEDGIHPTSKELKSLAPKTAGRSKIGSARLRSGLAQAPTLGRFGRW